MSEAKICPKCSGEMVKGHRITGHLVTAVRFTKMSDMIGDMIIPYYCRKCGFIELFKEMKDEKGYTELVQEMVGHKE